jgi:hypothetical protein
MLVDFTVYEIFVLKYILMFTVFIMGNFISLSILTFI